jgi:hypothetical protein
VRDLDVPEGVLAGVFSWSCQVSSWRAGVLLAAEVPIVGGSLSGDASAKVPERVDIVVPEKGWDGTRTRSWVPGADAYHPLAKYGQQLDVVITVTSSVTGASGSVSLGRFQVQSWDHDDVARQVRVEAVGVLQRAADARFLAPEAPRPGGTFASELARLAPAGVPVEFDGALVDRPVPQSFAWDEDRLGALYDLADAWPARLRVDSAGTLRVLPPLPDLADPVLTVADGVRGTLVSAPTSDARDSIPNIVVFRGSDTDDPARAPLTGVVARVPGGPMSPEEYGEVVEFFSSPLVRTVAQAQAAVNTRLANAQRPARQRVVSCVPDPRVELDDAMEVLTGVTHVSTEAPTVLDGGTTADTATYLDGGTTSDTASYLVGGAQKSSTQTLWSSREVGWVVGYELPLVVASDSDKMTLRVGVS